jgi:hypothetical protein
MGVSLGRVAGEIHFDDGFRLTARERILFDRLPLVIESYGYEIWRGTEKLFWYDSQPHPNDATLQRATRTISTFRRTSNTAEFPLLK